MHKIIDILAFLSSIPGMLFVLTDTFPRSTVIRAYTRYTAVVVISNQ